VGSRPQAFAYHFFAPVELEDSVREAFFLSNIIEQLAEWYGSAGQLPPESDLPRLRALYQDYVGRALDQPRALVIDGIDEVTTWDLRPYFGRTLPVGLHMILTAREVGIDWASRLELPVHQTRQRHLAGLSRAGIADVLLEAGGPAAAVAADPLVMSSIERQAAYEAEPALGADPFYVRFLAEDLAAGILTPETVRDTPRKLTAYLDDWYAEVAQAAGEAVARDVLATLVVALGPIGPADLRRLYPSLAPAWPFDPLQSVLDRVHRLVLTDEAGAMSLAHPRLKKHLQERLEQEAPDVVHMYAEQLLAYCARWSEHRGPYALSYFARHLYEAGEHERLYDLLGRPWSLARLEQNGTPRGLADDVSFALLATQSDQPRDLVQLARLAFIAAGLNELAASIPEECLYVLALYGRVDQSLSVASLIAEKWRQIDARLRISEALIARQDHATARNLLLEVLASLQEDGADYLLGEVRLGEVARLLLRVGELDQIIDFIERRIDNADARGNVLIEIADQVARDGDLEAAKHIIEKLERGNADVARSKAAERIAKTGQPRAIDQALELAGAIRAPAKRALALANIADGLASVGALERAASVAREAVRTFGRGPGGDRVLRLASKVLSQAGAIDEADALRKDMADPHWSWLAATDIALACARAGDGARAVEVVEGVLRTVPHDDWLEGLPGEHEDQNKNEADLPSVLVCAAAALARAGAVERAREIAESVQRTLEVAGRNGAEKGIVSVVEMLAEVGNLEAASSMATLANYGASFALSDAATSLQGRDVARALDVVERIDEEDQRAAALLGVVKHITEHNNREEATACIGRIESIGKQFAGGEAQATALGALALLQSVLGQASQALASSARALVAVELSADTAYNLQLREQIVRAVAESGDLSRALSLNDAAGPNWAGIVSAVIPTALNVGQRQLAIDLANRLVHAAAQTDSAVDWFAYMAAGALAEIGEGHRAVEEALRITDEDLRGQAFASVAAVIASSDAAVAGDLADRAFELMEAAQSGLTRANVMPSTASALAQLRDLARLRRAAALAMTSQDDPGTTGVRDVCVEAVTSAFAQIGALDEVEIVEGAPAPDIREAATLGAARGLLAVENVDAALARADRLTDPANITLVRSEAIPLLVRAGRIDDAERIARQARESAKASERDARSQTIATAAWALGSAKLVQEARELANELPEYVGQFRTYAFIEVARATAEAGQMEEAVAIWTRELLLTQVGGRAGVLFALAQAVPLIAHLGGVEALARIQMAIDEANSWWLHRREEARSVL
jgi:hypothetical protein